MHANGDDFIIVDRRGMTDVITSKIATRLGDRHRGIGFNQLAVVTDGEDADAKVKFWNLNGTTLNACGSGTRGVADMLMTETGRTSTLLRSPRGLLRCERGTNGAISVDMGPPSVDWRKVLVAQEVDTLWLPLPGKRGHETAERQLLVVS